MGKNNLILGTARGKLGDVVFYRTGGEQRFRTRVRPTNPRTNAQLVQRAIVSTAVKFYSAIATIGNHAFQNYEGSLKNHQRFMKLNIDMLRKIALPNIVRWSPIVWNKTNYGNYTWKNSQDISINPYIVSEGDITPIDYEFADGATGGTIAQVGPNISQAEAGINFTYKEVCNLLGINLGDQLTFVVCTSDENTGYIKNTYIGRIVMYPETGDGDTRFIQNQNIINPNHENYGEVKLTTYALSDDKGYALIIAPTEGQFIQADIIGFAVIVSRFENNKWRRSTQQIIVKDGFENTATLESAVASYLKSDTSSLYLNQATTDERELIYAKLAENEENAILVEEVEQKTNKRTKKSEE